MSPAPDVRQMLERLHRRWLLQSAVDTISVALLAVVTYMVTFTAWVRFVPQDEPTGFLNLAFLVLLAVGAYVAFKAISGHEPSLAQFAARLDRLAGTHDRLTTALAFSEGTATPMQKMAQQECQQYLAGRDFRPLLPWRFPRELAWLPVPLIAFALLSWDIRLQTQAREQLAAEAQEKTSPAVEALRELARELEKKAADADDPELKKLAEEVARRAEALRQTSDPSEAEKARLRELSALEQLAQEMQQRREKMLSADEMQAIAKALEQAEATRKAAEQMKAGENGAAADELEKTAKRAEQEGEGSDAAKAEAALRQALKQLAEQKELSQGAQSQLTPGQQSALQRLADALRQMGPQKGGPQNRQKSQGSPQSLNDLLTALQNMKFGSDGKPGQPSSDKGDAPSSPRLQISPSTAQSDGPTVDLPGASPNAGEKDTGTTNTPFGDKQEAAKKGADLALSGEQTDRGETHTQALPGRLDVSRSSRQYKQLYDAMAAEAESAVLQEDIPLGSRLFIKRYFEAIRPTQ